MTTKKIINTTFLINFNKAENLVDYAKEIEKNKIDSKNNNQVLVFITKNKLNIIY